MKGNDELLESKPAAESKRVYFVFILLGITTLYPWNAFLNAYDYFSFALKGSSWEQSFMSYVASSYSWTMLIMMISMVIFQLDQRFSLTGKAMTGLVLNFILLTGMTLLPLVDLLNGNAILSPRIFFLILLTIVSTIAIGTALVMKTSFTLISLFPPRYVPAFNAGQAIAGIVVSCMALISSLIGSVEKSRSMVLKSTVFYFGSSMLVLAMTIIGFYWLSRQDSYASALANFKPQPASIRKNIKSFKNGVKLVWDLAVGVMMALTVTIAVITSYIPNAQSTSTTGLWPTIYLSVVFLVFSIGDVTGRWLPAFKAFTFRRRSRKPLAIPWIRLVIFVPLFLMSNMRGEFTGLRSHLPTLIRSDWLYMIVVFLFGLTSGYSTTTLMMIAPEQSERKYLEVCSDLPDGVEGAKGTSGTIMGLFIIFGLVLGSMGSFLLRLLL